jgi:phosphomannomutase
MEKRLSLKISISGVRGIVGDSLTPQLSASFAQAFGSYLGRGRVIVGQDARISGEMIKMQFFPVFYLLAVNRLISAFALFLPFYI